MSGCAAFHAAVCLLRPSASPQNVRVAGPSALAESEPPPPQPARAAASAQMETTAPARPLTVVRMRPPEASHARSWDRKRLPWNVRPHGASPQGVDARDVAQRFPAERTTREDA